MIINKPILAVDIDETINNLVPTLLKKYNEKYNDNVKYEDIVDYNLHKFLKPECENIFNEFCDEELFKSLKPVNYSRGCLEMLLNDFEIYFLTAGHPLTAPYRYEWLKKYYSSVYKNGRLVMCRDKHLFKCNILIDDYQENLLKMPDNCIKILVSQPWNINFNAESNGMIRVNDWYDIYTLFNSELIPEMIRNRSKNGNIKIHK